jgi:hypothetical protein
MGAPSLHSTTALAAPAKSSFNAAMARRRFAQSSPALAIIRAVAAPSVTSTPPALATAMTASSSDLAMHGLSKPYCERDLARMTAIELKAPPSNRPQLLKAPALLNKPAAAFRPSTAIMRVAIFSSSVRVSGTRISKSAASPSPALAG